MNYLLYVATCMITSLQYCSLSANLRSVSIQTANLNSNFYYMHVPWYGVIFIVEFIKCLLRASIKNTKTLSLSLFDMRA